MSDILLVNKVLNKINKRINDSSKALSIIINNNMIGGSIMDKLNKLGMSKLIKDAEIRKHNKELETLDNSMKELKDNMKELENAIDKLAELKYEKLGNVPTYQDDDDLNIEDDKMMKFYNTMNEIGEAKLLKLKKTDISTPKPTDLLCLISSKDAFSMVSLDRNLSLSLVFLFILFISI